MIVSSEPFKRAAGAVTAGVGTASLLLTPAGGGYSNCAVDLRATIIDAAQ